MRKQCSQHPPGLFVKTDQQIQTETDGQTNRHRQTYKQTGRQTRGVIEGQLDGWMDTLTVLALLALPGQLLLWSRTYPGAGQGFCHNNT